MSEPSERRLTDPEVLAAHRARARRSGPELFLHRLLRDEIEERLEEVNRTFTKPAVITPFPEVWDDFPATLVAEGDTLAFPSDDHDLVIHALALHWADDPVGQLIQCARALRPDGLMLAAFFGGRTLTELRDALAAAEIATRGGLSPRVLPMADLRDAGALLQRAGLALPVADLQTRQITYPDLPALIRDLRAMGETSALADRDRRTPPRAFLPAAAAAYADRHALPDGRLPVTVDTVFLSGWAPADSQPKPLRPGSADVSLARFLGDADDAAD